MILLGHGLESLRPTLHNGPGWRVPLWVQGCRLRCTELCLNPHYLSEHGRHEAEPRALADAVLRTADGDGMPVEGVTVLGGEPMEQAEELAVFLRAVREAGLSTMVYSGYTLAALRALPGNGATLDAIDLLIDGPFVASRYDDTLAWRGSSNQRIHRLSERYSAADLDEAFARQRKGFSVHVSGDGRLTVSGLQERAGASRVERRVADGRVACPDT